MITQENNHMEKQENNCIIYNEIDRILKGIEKQKDICITYDKINQALNYIETKKDIRITYDERVSIALTLERVINISNDTNETPAEEIKKEKSFRGRFEWIDFVHRNDNEDDCTIKITIFTNYMINNLNLTKFLHLSIFSNLLVLYLENCSIYSMEKIISCLVNIKNMKSIDLTNNQIRSIKPIIKLNSKCTIFISKDTRLEEYFKKQTYLFNFSDSIYKDEIRDYEMELISHRKISHVTQQLNAYPNIIDPKSFERFDLTIQDHLTLNLYAKIKSQKSFDYERLINQDRIEYLIGNNTVSDSEISDLQVSDSEISDLEE